MTPEEHKRIFEDCHQQLFDLVMELGRKYGNPMPIFGAMGHLIAAGIATFPPDARQAATDSFIAAFRDAMAIYNAEDNLSIN
jgi:hypothetical protein